MTAVTNPQPSEQDTVKIGEVLHLGPVWRSMAEVAEDAQQVIDIQDDEYHGIHFHKSDDKETLKLLPRMSQTSKAEWKIKVLRKLQAPVMDNREQDHFVLPIQEAN